LEEKSGRIKEYYFKTKPGEDPTKEFRVWQTIKAANVDDAEIFFVEVGRIKLDLV